MVAHLDLADLGANCLDHAGAFVAQHDRHRHREMTVFAAHVGVADAGADHSYKDFVLARCGHLDIFNHPRGSRLADHRCARCCTHASSVISSWSNRSGAATASEKTWVKRGTTIYFKSCMVPYYLTGVQRRFAASASLHDAWMASGLRRRSAPIRQATKRPSGGKTCSTI